MQYSKFTHKIINFVKLKILIALLNYNNLAKIKNMLGTEQQNVM